MKSPNYKVKIGIIGCGAIGSRMARAVNKDFAKDCRVTGLYDIDPKKAEKLAKELKLNKIATESLNAVIQKCDCVVEAVNTDATIDIAEKAIKARKSILVMSVGRLLEADHLFKLARKNKCYILLPSGAVAGVDAIKAASLAKISKITLTTRKPPSGLGDNPYFDKHGIDIHNITKETVVFEGNAKEALKYFPQNINVGATVALASGNINKVKIQLVTSPEFKKNSHEIALEGDFGKIVTKTENVVCPDNPKTSYLSVLSGLQTLKQYCTGFLIGT